MRLAAPERGEGGRTSYPGLQAVWISTPTGLCHGATNEPQPRWGCLPSPTIPRVARSSPSGIHMFSNLMFLSPSIPPGEQPWALSRNPFGIYLWNFRKALGLVWAFQKFFGTHCHLLSTSRLSGVVTRTARSETAKAVSIPALLVAAPLKRCSCFATCRGGVIAPESRRSPRRSTNLMAGSSERKLLDCASPLALWEQSQRVESGRGLPQSKTLRVQRSCRNSIRRPGSFSHNSHKLASCSAAS